ncbi:MAG: ABC transporter permease [Planctomycetes bacterium]|nr:ABC transporter permease [Planctomycetota bacterium]
MFRIAVRMLLGDKSKYLSLVLGLSFAALLIAQQGAIFLGLMQRATGPLQNVGQPDFWVADPKTRYVGEVRPLSESDLLRVRSIPGVAWAEPFYAARALCELPDTSFKTVQLFGIDRTTFIGQPPMMIAGSIEDLRMPDAVIIEESAIPKLGGVGIGDTLRLNDQRAVVVGICRATSGFESNALVFTTFQNALRYVPQPRNSITFILVKSKDGADKAQVAAAIDAIPTLKAFTGEELVARNTEFIIVETGIGINFGITVMLGFIVGVIVSASIFYQFTVENLRNFAVLKAVGARSRLLIGMILLQAFLVAIVGFGIGVGLAGVFSWGARRPGAELAAYFPWPLLIISFFAMLFCVGAGSVLSLRRVLTLEPAVVFK